MRKAWAARSWLVAGLATLAITGGGAGVSRPTAKTATDAAAPKQLAALGLDLASKGSPGDLTACVLDRARRIAPAEVSALTSSLGGSSGSRNAQLAAGPLVGCLRDGRGLSTLRAEIAGRFEAGLADIRGATRYKAAMDRCMLAQVARLSARQLSDLVGVYFARGALAAHSAGFGLGLRLAGRCFARPDVLAAVSSGFTARLAKDLRSRHLPAGYERCLLSTIRRLVPSRLRLVVKAFITTGVQRGIAAAHAEERALASELVGRGLGAQAAQACAGLRAPTLASA